MTNILAVGDTHGNTSAVVNVAIPQARKNDCKLIVQVGDFGTFQWDERFLDKVSKHLVRNDIVMYFLDGNHDDHPKLWSKYQVTTKEGLCSVRPNLFYIPRGTVFKLDHVTCLGLGGAYSIDKESRLSRMKMGGPPEWFETETITPLQAFQAKENARELGPVDVMFTHDAPERVEVPDIRDKWRYPLSQVNRELLQDVFTSVQPKLLIHGHYHVRYTDRLPLRPRIPMDCGPLEWDYCRVDGLANDGFPGFAIVLDLDSLFVRDY